MQVVLTFWQKWRVFIIGAAASAVFAIQELMKNQADQSLKVYLYAGLMAVLSYVASQWRGQTVTILGVIGTLAYAFVNLQQSGHFTWPEFFLAAISAILSSVASPAKPLTYEKDATIVKAKEFPPVDSTVDDSTLPKSPAA